MLFFQDRVLAPTQLPPRWVEEEEEVEYEEEEEEENASESSFSSEQDAGQSPSVDAPEKKDIPELDWDAKKKKIKNNEEAKNAESRIFFDKDTLKKQSPHDPTH